LIGDGGFGICGAGGHGGGRREGCVQGLEAVTLMKASRLCDTHSLMAISGGDSDGSCFISRQNQAYYLLGKFSQIKFGLSLLSYLRLYLARKWYIGVLWPSSRSNIFWSPLTAWRRRLDSQNSSRF
jgi:hypothetical protein